MSDPKLQPPKWADRCLGWYCSPQVREQVQGDAHELYYWRLEDKGKRVADRAFIWDVVRLFRWANIKRTTGQNRKINNIAMFKNYFKIGLRNLWKQKMSSTINVIGLSMAIGCCLVAFKFIEMNLVRDDFHENGDNIYLTTHTAFLDGGLNRYGFMSVGISDLMEEDYPAIKNIVRYSRRSVSVELGDRTFATSACFVDVNYLNTFSFALKYGEKELLKEPRNIAISTPTAIRYFGDEYPIGKTISMEFSGEKRDFIVAGVLEDIPGNSSMRPNILVNFDLVRKGKELESMRAHVFVQTVEGTDINALSSSFASLAEVQRGYLLDRKYDEIGLQPLETMAKNADVVIDGLGRQLSLAPMVVIASIGLFMLILSIFNYVNIAILMATKRMKEIGVRKVIGGRRGQLIVQFLTENLILCLIAMAIGCLLASGFFLPEFNKLSGNDFTLNLLDHRNLWLFLGAMLFFITVVSGAYPAFYISSFKPAIIFRGNQKLGKKRRFTGVLLSFQFVLAIVTIVAGIMFVRTNKANESRAWGYDKHDKVVLNIPNKKYYPQLRNELMQQSGIVEIAGSRGIVGEWRDPEKVILNDETITVRMIEGALNYVSLLDLKLSEGRYFQEDFKSDQTSAVIVNQTFIDRFGLENPLEETLTIKDKVVQVIGVLEDFHFHNFDEEISPAVVRVIPDSLMTHMTIQVQAGTGLAMQGEIGKTWDAIIADHEYESMLQSEVFDFHFEDARGISNVMVFTASLAVILSAMGLFGLVSLSISSHIKDFGIKKILGATGLQIGKEVYKKFALILAIAIVLGSAAAVVVINQLLDTAYGYHESIGILTLMLAAAILLGIAWLTINSQVTKVQRMNPAETLRVE